MKVAYFITSADNGGAPKYVLALAQRFDSVIVAGTTLGTEMLSKASTLGIKNFPLKYFVPTLLKGNDFRAFREIYEIIKSTKPDILHVNPGKIGLMAAIAGRWQGLPIVFTPHGFVFTEAKGIIKKIAYRILDGAVAFLADAILCISEEDKKTAVKHWISRSEKCVVIYNGIDTIQFFEKQSAREKLALPDDKFIIGTIANSFHTKGLDVLIHSASIIHKNISKDILFVNIGSGPLESQLRKQIELENAQMYFKMLGSIDNASVYLPAFDLFLLPSLKEGLPYVILEAMQAGLPIVASDVGAIREVLSGAGFLIKPGSPEEILSAVRFAFQHPKELEQKAMQAQKRSSLFTIDQMILQTEGLYKKLLAKKHP